MARAVDDEPDRARRHEQRDKYETGRSSWVQCSGWKLLSGTELSYIIPAC